MTRFKDLRKRVVAGIIGATLIVTGVVLDPWSYFVVFLVILALTQWEFYGLLKGIHYHPQQKLGTFFGMCIYIFTFFHAQEKVSASLFWIFVPAVHTAFIFKLYQKENQPFVNLAFYFLGLFYVALPFALFNYIVFEDGKYNYLLALGIIMLHWAHDVGGYFAGNFFGKHKLFPRVSPNKSWEGLIGGIIFSLLIAFIFSYFDFPNKFFEWMLIGLTVSIISTFGDLIESLFKRSLEIKDSGSIIPGHGGFLDRFDGMLISLPFLMLLISLFRSF